MSSKNCRRASPNLQLRILKQCQYSIPVNLRACAITRSSCVATLKLCGSPKIVAHKPKQIAQKLPHNNNPIQDLPGLVCLGVDGVGEGGTNPGAVIFGITRKWPLRMEAKQQQTERMHKTQQLTRNSAKPTSMGPRSERILKQCQYLVLVKPGACAVTRPSCVAILKLCDRFLQKPFEPKNFEYNITVFSISLIEKRVDEDNDNYDGGGDTERLQFTCKGIGLMLENLVEQKINRGRYHLSYVRISS
ncbi:hypothetical protein M9H77_26476 [Catharanthus roseus]|uniref:Uncharacterized protein n=1 Tax=Catharanthus roseus TaxID=4058 RepID=A0ACC0AE15_CATRO|nr:hypothetical protein M9H77_26476 [Catharanthus roseus]